MLSYPHLKTYCPADLKDPRRNRFVRWLQAVGRSFPFVMPWSVPVRMIGAVLSDSTLVFAHGSLRGDRLRVTEATRVSRMNLVTGSGDRSHYDGEPVCVCLPRDRTLVRHFRVPSESAAEIESMLPHLLASELPMSLEHFSWVWLPLHRDQDGHSLVAVYVARIDSLTECLAPLAQWNLNVVGFVPEGWAWAHAMREHRNEDPDADPDAVRSVLIKGDNGPFLVVEQASKLLFEAQLPPAAMRRTGAEPEESAPPFAWDGPDFGGVRKQFEDLLHFPLPVPKIWPDALENDEDAEELFFAASIAACAIEHQRLMAPPDLLRRNRRTAVVRTLSVLGRIAVYAFLFWAGYTLIADRQTRYRLAALEHSLAAERQAVLVLEQEWNAIRENSRERAGETVVLRALASLRHHVLVPIHLEHMNYTQGQAVTLRGGAPTSQAVLEMTDQLATDPLWQGLRVTQLRAETFNGVEQVHFVVEGQLQ